MNALGDAQWATAVAEQVRALEAAAIAADWTGADLCTTTLAALLAAPPDSNRAHTEAVFRHAYQAVGRVSTAARTAHDAVRAELAQLAVERKVAAAYR